MSALSVRDIGISFGGVKAVDTVSFDVEEGSIFSIIGPNGAGKTTLFNLISGVYVPMTGSVSLFNEDVTAVEPDRLVARGLSRTFQNLQIFFRMTVAENVMVGRHLKEARGIFPHLLALPSVIRQNRDSRSEAIRLLDRIGLAGRADDLAANLPYGELKRLEIARALATQPKVLLLDEPAAGCNPRETEGIEHLIEDIAREGVTVVLVEHDMKLVMRISNRLHVLDYGRTLTEGNAEEVRSNPDVIRAYLGTHGAEEAARAQR